MTDTEQTTQNVGHRVGPRIQKLGRDIERLIEQFQIECELHVTRIEVTPADGSVFRLRAKVHVGSMND